MGDFSKGGVHETDSFWGMIFQRGEYTKPMAFDGFWNLFHCSEKLGAQGVYFGRYGKCLLFFIFYSLFIFKLKVNVYSRSWKEK